MCAAPPGSLSIRVLGPLELLVDEAPLIADTRKAQAILALLAVEDRAFARDELAAMFWPEADEEAARGSLRRTLSTLRAGLGDRWLAIDRSTVALIPAATGLDLRDVERAGATAATEDLAAAALLVRGSFLAGFNLRDSPGFDDWRAARASAVERSIADLLDRLAGRYEMAGNLAAAIRTVTRRLELDALDEPTQRRLIGLLAEAGERSAAIRRYRSCVSVLERELGVAPLAETTALYESIRDGSYQAPSRFDGGVPEAGGESASHPSAAAEADVPAADRPPSPPLVGRQAELDLIMAAHRAAGPDGRVIVLEGEPGIGKSRLAEEAASRAATSGASVLTMRAHRAESGIAYAPVVELLRTAMPAAPSLARLAGLPDEVLGELARLVALPPGLARGRGAERGGPGDASLARARLVDAIVVTIGVLLEGPSAGVLVVDDLHWVDTSTLEMLRYLMRRLEGRAILVLLTWCAEDLSDDGDGVAALAAALPDSTGIPLRRLDRASSANLVRALVRSPDGPPREMIERLVDASEGLPLYLVERLAERPDDHPPHQPEAAPHSFRTLLRERLGRVGEAAAQVLAAGAVIGRSFDLATVRATSGRSEEETVEALDELIRRGLIRESAVDGELRFDFTHGSLRQAAYETTSLVRRRLLHRRVAEALRAGVSRLAGGGELGRLVLVAQHERDAGRDVEAADAFLVAAERARALFASREAMELAEQAIALGHPAVGAVQRMLGELRLGVGDYRAAIAAFEVAVGGAEGAEAVELELLLGRAHARRGDLAGAASHLDEALASSSGEVLKTDAWRRLRVRILVERSAVALRGGHAPVARRAANEALALAVQASDTAGAGLSHRILGLLDRARGDLPAARAQLAESLALAQAGQDAGGAIAAANALALVEAATGDHAAAIRLLVAAGQSARRVGERHLEAAIENNLADSYHAAGDEGQSMAHLRRAVALFAEIGGRPGELEPEIWKLESW